ncbi:MAG: hypothetical protein OHK0053_23680 [Microscillaceae bacterium]
MQHKTDHLTQAQNWHSLRQSLEAWPPQKWGAAGEILGRFLALATTATARATFYNTQAEQEQALNAAHEALFAFDRGLYALCLLLEGLTDYSRQLGIRNLAQQARGQGSGVLLDEHQEDAIVHLLFRDLPVQRVLNLFGMLKAERVNNTRARRMILLTLLNSPKLEYWAVKYRKKMRTALQHAWGERTTGILKSILSKPQEHHTEKERGIVQKNILKYVQKLEKQALVQEALGFVLGNEENLRLELPRAFVAAKQNIEAGYRLPYEVLEGIRSIYHPEIASKKVLELTKANLSKGQKMVLQNKAEKESIVLDFDPNQYDAVRLYLYAFARGLSPEIKDALEQKAQQTAQLAGVRFQKIAVLVDASASMQGHKSQALRPMAIALALRDVLANLADNAVFVYSNEHDSRLYELIRPEGATDLAPYYLQLLKEQAEAIFILTDGYENAPAGRLGELMYLARANGLGLPPTYQLTAVAAAEAEGLRSLSTLIPILPLSRPEGLASGLMAILLESHPQKGLAILLNMVLPKLTIGVE